MNSNIQPSQEGPPSQRRILISGASGLIGHALSSALQNAGANVTALVRKRSDVSGIFWDPDANLLDPSLLSGFDAVIHLAGEPVGNGRWTRSKKEKIYNSRVNGTTLLANALLSAEVPPRLFLCASGINYYQSAGSKFLDETATPGTGFLAKVCRDWERAAAILTPVSRVITLRIGVVLSKDGGTLAKMLPLFRSGLGAYVGGGGDYLSWISLSDLVRAVLHILTSDALEGPINLVSPEPVTGRTFAEELGRTVGHTARFRIPAFVPRLALGEFAEETILSSVRAIPTKLLDDGFTFESTTIGDAFDKCVNQQAGR